MISARIIGDVLSDNPASAYHSAAEALDSKGELDCKRVIISIRFRRDQQPNRPLMLYALEIVDAVADHVLDAGHEKIVDVHTYVAPSARGAGPCTDICVREHWTCSLGSKWDD